MVAGAVAGAVALGIYLVLLQRTFYGDVVGTLVQIDEGRALQSAVHGLHAPVVQGFWMVLDPFGVGLYWAGCLVSAVGTGVGVMMCYAASRRMGLDATRAGYVAGLVAVCPAVLFFATVFEVHGLFFAFSGLAAWCFALLVERPALRGAVLLGLSTGLGFFAHASANLLPWFYGLALVLVVRQRDGGGLRRLLGLALVTLVAHHLVVYGGAWLLRQLGLSAVDPAASAENLQKHLAWLDRSWWEIGHTWYVEWLRPYFPLGVVALAGFWRRTTRPLALALHLGLVPFVLFAFLLIQAGDEFGAYALPLVWPAALLAGRVLGVRWLAVLLAVTAVLAVAKVVDHDVDARSAAGQVRAEAVRALAGDRPVLLLIGARTDVALRFVDLPAASHFFFPTLAIREAAAVRAWFPTLERRLRAHLDRGGCVLLPRDSQALLLDPAMQARSSGTTAFLEELRREFELHPVSRGTFSGAELRAAR